METKLYPGTLAYKLEEETVKMGMNKELNWGRRFKGYQIQQAVQYALTYAIEPNPEFGNYEKWGGDCTNFVSQCLHAGDIPFDYEGIDVRYQWYWYSETTRTPSWTAANSLKFYMEHNKTDQDGNLSLGLKAAPIKLNQLLRGDVVQFVKRDGHSYHSVIVTDYVVRNGRVVDYLISQRTEDAINYPLSRKKGIKIFWSMLGYVT